MTTSPKSIFVPVVASLILAWPSPVRAQNGNKPTQTSAAPSASNAGPVSGGTTNQTGPPVNAGPGQGHSPAAQGFGAGMILGNPTGLTLKGWLTSSSALDFDLGEAFGNRSGLQLSGDYLIHNFDLLHVDRGQLPVYLGLGGRLEFPDHRDTRFGFRIPLGLAYEFPDTPVELFAEIAPIIDVVPAGALRWNGGVGMRYYFH